MNIMMADKNINSIQYSTVNIFITKSIRYRSWGRAFLVFLLLLILNRLLVEAIF